jgi:hypothetical protein
VFIIQGFTSTGMKSAQHGASTLQYGVGSERVMSRDADQMTCFSRAKSDAGLQTLIFVEFRGILIDTPNSLI